MCIRDRVCDGFICHGFTTEKYLREVTLPNLAEGRERAGKSMDDFMISGPFFVVSGNTEQEFDAAMAELDPEFSNAHKNDDVGNDEDDTIAQLRDFAAKVDWASSDFSKPLHPARDHTKHDHSQRPKPAVETEAKPAPGSRKQDPGELQRGFMARDAERSAAKAAVRRAAWRAGLVVL